MKIARRAKKKKAGKSTHPSEQRGCPLIAPHQFVEPRPSGSGWSFRFLMGAAPGIDGLKSVLAVAEDEPLADFDFVADEFGQAGVVSVQALEEEQQRMVPAPFEFVADGWTCSKLLCEWETMLLLTLKRELTRSDQRDVREISAITGSVARDECVTFDFRVRSDAEIRQR